MPKTGALQFGFPRFQGAVRQIVLLSIGIWVALLLLWAFDRPLAEVLLAVGSLIPDAVRHGWGWQFLTYGFSHLGPGHLFATMLGVFAIGSSAGERVGARAPDGTSRW